MDIHELEDYFTNMWDDRLPTFGDAIYFGYNYSVHENGWVSPMDKSPIDGEEVICYHMDGTICSSRYDGEWSDDVAYWMPIPQLPNVWSCGLND